MTFGEKVNSIVLTFHSPTQVLVILNFIFFQMYSPANRCMWQSHYIFNVFYYNIPKDMNRKLFYFWIFLIPSKDVVHLAPPRGYVWLKVCHGREQHYPPSPIHYSVNFKEKLVFNGLLSMWIYGMNIQVWSSCCFTVFLLLTYTFSHSNFNTFKYHVFEPMGRFQLELILFCHLLQ